MVGAAPRNTSRNRRSPKLIRLCSLVITASGLAWQVSAMAWTRSEVKGGDADVFILSSPKVQSSPRAHAFAGSREPLRQVAGEPNQNKDIVGRRGLLTAVSSATNSLGFWGKGFVLFALLKLFGLYKLKVWLDTPSRPYAASSNSNSVRAEYDQWTREGVLEHYWGEHIHMGSYSPMTNILGYKKSDWFVIAFLRASWAHLFGRYKNFIDAKLDFTKEFVAWSGVEKTRRILDVGCGIGGTSRYLAKIFPEAEITGITLSPQQVARATELAQKAGLSNVEFKVADALKMPFEDNTYDLVVGCESGEHMPDKKGYIEEMTRVLQNGGKLLVATWCERDPVPPFSADERAMLKYTYEEWSHPYFISISSYKKLMEGTKSFETIETEDWTERTLPSWRHSIWVGVWSPRYWLKVAAKRPKAFLGFLRDAYCLEVYHQAMKTGLLQYGMLKATKKAK